MENLFTCGAEVITRVDVSDFYFVEVSENYGALKKTIHLKWEKFRWTI